MTALEVAAGMVASAAGSARAHFLRGLSLMPSASASAGGAGVGSEAVGNGGVPGALRKEMVLAAAPHDPMVDSCPNSRHWRPGGSSAAGLASRMRMAAVGEEAGDGASEVVAMVAAEPGPLARDGGPSVVVVARVGGARMCVLLLVVTSAIGVPAARGGVGVMAETMAELKTAVHSEPAPVLLGQKARETSFQRDDVRAAA